MKCAWKELMAILPSWIGAEADKQGRNTLQEIRMRLGKPPELVLSGGSIWLNRMTTRDDIQFSVNTASRYSPWASQSIADGYVTSKGGHRLGLCGEAVMQGGRMSGLREIRSLNIRVARDFPGIGAEAAKLEGSILLIGPPGSGKTTLLRDLLRKVSMEETVAVVDERGELFPDALCDFGKRLDILTGCPKSEGIDTVLRTMGPDCIGVDEVTRESDCDALLRAGWCGVRLIATAHAASLADLQQRPVYRPLVERRLFEHVLVLSRDKSWHWERIDQ